ncbi:MAG: hypothetical protein WCS13_01380 [Candidatus Cloacimonadaceae bacterium]|jgi:hypothetical protein
MKKIISYFYIIVSLAPLIAYYLYQVSSIHDFYWYARICITILGIGLILESLAFKKKLTIPSFLIPLFFYTIYLMVWAMVNGDLQRRGVLYFFNNGNIQTILMILICYNITLSNKLKDYLINIFFITVIISALVSIYQIYNPSFLLTDIKSNVWDIYQIRRGSIFSIIDPLDIGLSLLPILSILIVEYINMNKNINIIMLLLFLGGLVSVLSNTRWIMVAYIIILMMIIFHYNPTFFGKTRNIIIVLISIFIIIISIIYFGYDLKAFWQKRLFPEGSLLYTTRYYALENFNIFFPRKPWFGTGVHLTDEIYITSLAVGSSQIHVGYLSHLISYGMVGSFFLFGFWIWLAITLWRHAKITGYWGSFYTFLIFLWGEASWVHFSLFHYGIIFALIFDNYYLNNYYNNNYYNNNFNNIY